MSVTVYKKGVDSAMDTDFTTAQPFGRVKLGKTALFWKKGLKWSTLPLSEICRAYRRLEEVRGKTGCCSNDFSIHKLMVEQSGGGMLEILIGDSLYRHEPERLMEAMKEQNPDILYQKP